MKIYVFLAEGFEEIEAVTIIDVLRRAKMNVQTVSVTKRKEVTGSHNMTLTADLLFDTENLKDGAMLVLPGGMPGTTNLGAHTGLASLLTDYFERNLWLAAICAAPIVLGKLGLLKGRMATCFPGCEADLTGATCSTSNIVEDGKIITSRGPGTAMDFSLKLVEVLAGAELSNKLRIGMLA